jgi:hypothetical protein
MAFDLLAAAGADIRSEAGPPAAGGWSRWRTGCPPLQLSPVTEDVDEERVWYEILPAAWTSMNSVGSTVPDAQIRIYLRRADDPSAGWSSRADSCRIWFPKLGCAMVLVYARCGL